METKVFCLGEDDCPRLWFGIGDQRDLDLQINTVISLPRLDFLATPLKIRPTRCVALIHLAEK